MSYVIVLGNLEEYATQNLDLIEANFRRGVWVGFLLNEYDCDNLQVEVPEGKRKDVYR